MGYHRAGFDLVGVDIQPQKRYPFEFHQGDALEFVAKHGREFDVIHASPPCQRWSVSKSMWPGRERPDLLTPTLALLCEIDRLWIVENVPLAPLSPWSTELCGLMFGLRVFRHRRFECSSLILAPPHQPHGRRRIGLDGYVCVAGHGDADRHRIPYSHRSIASWRTAMGIDWMTRAELAQAIPPAYTEYIGKQLMRRISGERPCNISISSQS